MELLNISAANHKKIPGTNVPRKKGLLWFLFVGVSLPKSLILHLRSYLAISTATSRTAWMIRSPGTIKRLNRPSAPINGCTERLGRYHENWVEYRSACEMLKHEKNLYLMDAYPYGTDETKEQLFVHNIENLLSSEGNKWKASNIKAASPKEKTHSETGS